jgi:hypothetical protein
VVNNIKRGNCKKASQQKGLLLKGPLVKGLLKKGPLYEKGLLTYFWFIFYLYSIFMVFYEN